MKKIIRRILVFSAMVVLSVSCSAPPFFPGISNAAKLISKMEPGASLAIRDIPQWELNDIDDRSPFLLLPPAVSAADMLDTGMYVFFPRGYENTGEYLFFDARDPEADSESRDFLSVSTTLDGLQLVLEEIVLSGGLVSYYGIDLYNENLELWPAGMYPIVGQDGGRGILKVELDGAYMNIQAQVPADEGTQAFKAAESAAFWDNTSATNLLSSEPEYASEGFSTVTEDYLILGFSPPYQGDNPSGASRLSYLVYYWPNGTVYEIALEYDLQLNDPTPIGTINLADPAVQGIIQLPEEEDGRPDQRYSQVGFYHLPGNDPDSPRYFSMVDRDIAEFVTFRWEGGEPGLSSRNAEKVVRNGEPVQGRLLGVLHDNTLVFNSQGKLFFYGEGSGRWAQLNPGSLEFLGERYDPEGEQWRVFFRYELRSEQEPPEDGEGDASYVFQQSLYSISTEKLYGEIGF